MKRILIGFFAAPLIPALCTVWTARTGDYHPLATFIFISGAFYSLQLVIGVPATIVLRQRQMHGLAVYVALGILGTTVPLLSWMLYRCPSEGCRLVDAVWYAGHFGLLGGIAAAVFWLVARPDKPKAAEL
jgi:hypothetical protein